MEITVKPNYLCETPEEIDSLLFTELCSVCSYVPSTTGKTLWGISVSKHGEPAWLHRMLDTDGKEHQFVSPDGGRTYLDKDFNTYTQVLYTYADYYEKKGEVEAIRNDVFDAGKESTCRHRLEALEESIAKKEQELQDKLGPSRRHAAALRAWLEAL
jgi:hypothetical protein